ncbi:TetR/AcrR family transcriptional regulator [Amycolatopsis pithecellobii]|uniref:TetR family transcriptional regulator n=1 Tax=Amycolatopsis pithecellobii TaxID=664692 RepID=A0A6N7YX54_9PSEU|nr:TetR/AcrR family transcriptional regulator [Amycolatopsis pithecellobii]MTD52919.1 TetR family transcriptional regulator [Amycolatopsis pithecellobii]
MTKRLSQPREVSDRVRGVRSARGQRTIDEITRSADKLFASQGYFSTTVEDIAKEAGRSSAAVYQYFDNKAAILELLSERLVDFAGPRALERIPLPENEYDHAAFVRAAAGFWQTYLTFKGVMVALFQLSTVDERFAGIEKKVRAVGHQVFGIFLARAREHGFANDVDQKLTPVLIDVMNEHYRFISSGHLISPDRQPESFDEVSVLAAIWYRAFYAVPREPIVHVPLKRSRKARKPARSEGKELWAAAGRHVFEQKSFLTAGVRDIAEEAGMSLGAFYNYFDTKEDLLLHLAEEFNDTILQGLRFPDEPGSMRISRLVTTLWRTYTENRAVVHGIFQLSMLDSEFAADWRRTRRPVVKLIEDHVIQAEADRGGNDLDAAGVAEALWSMLEHCAYLWGTRRSDLMVGAVSEAELCRAMSDLWYRVLHGVLPPDGLLSVL